MDNVQSGARLGQYIFEQRLGRGGMAEVWKARNAVLGHAVAIKFLNSQFAGNPNIEQRFLEEGRRQANMQHPCIVSAFDFLYEDGRSFLVMKYVEGEDVDTRLSRLGAPMPFAMALAISNDALSALGHAHSQGVIHRDVKPSNILVDTSGRAYVLDFGIALALGQQRLTRAGTLGTLNYMSPEQIVGARDLDHRSDIYSYGCTLYQMLTLTPPFAGKDGEGGTDFVIAERHMRAPVPPPSALNPSIPEHVERVILRCMEKLPADRYFTCADVMEALNAREPISTNPPALKQQETPVHQSTMAEPNFPQTPAPPSRPLQTPSQVTAMPAAKSNATLALAALGALIFILMAGVGYLFWERSKQKTEPPETPVPVVKEIPQTTPSTGSAATPLPQPAAKRVAENPPVAVARQPVEAPQQVEAPPVVKTVPPVEKAVPVETAQTGVLHCSAAEQRSFGNSRGFLFENLPQHLKFPPDINSYWHIQFKHTDSTHQDVLLIPLRQGVTDCSIPWTVKSANPI